MRSGDEAIGELEWWIDFLAGWNRNAIIPMEAEVDLFSDASNKGYGGYMVKNGDKSTSGARLLDPREEVSLSQRERINGRRGNSFYEIAEAVRDYNQAFYRQRGYYTLPQQNVGKGAPPRKGAPPTAGGSKDISSLRDKESYTVGRVRSRSKEQYCRQVLKIGMGPFGR